MGVVWGVWEGVRNGLETVNKLLGGELYGGQDGGSGEPVEDDCAKGVSESYCCVQSYNSEYKSVLQSCSISSLGRFSDITEVSIDKHDAGSGKVPAGT